MNATILFPHAEASAAEACIRCAACLPACPTYARTGLERESPRGRVQLVRAGARGEVALDDYYLRQMYDCLDCRACEVACPVGVPIGTLVLEARRSAQSPDNLARTSGGLTNTARRLLHRHVFGAPRRMEVPLFLTRWLYQRTGLQRLVRRLGFLRVAPPLHRLEQWLPDLPDRPWRWRYENRGERLEAVGPRQLRAAYFLGCFMNSIFADASVASVEVVRRCGVEVLTPIGITCCGAPQTDVGEHETARAFARQNIEALEGTNADVIFADCAACSGMLKEYGHLLADDPSWAPRAARVSARTQDFTELMRDLMPAGPPLGRVERRVTYHDPCHLANAQRVTQAPRDVLARIPGVEVVEMAQSTVCCGSAGVYSFRRPDESQALLDTKIQHVLVTEAETVVTVNPGCLGQLAMGMRQRGETQRVRHLSELLLEAYEAGAR